MAREALLRLADLVTGSLSTQMNAYKSLIDGASSEADLKGIVSQVLDPSNNVSLVVARPVLTELITKAATSQDVLSFALQSLTPRGSTFEEQLNQIREALATCQEHAQEYLEAARTLQGITLESGQRVISDEYKLSIYIRIIRCLLEEEEEVNADAYLNRATLLIHNTTNPELLLPFRLSQARIFDAKRRFIEASQKYHELSFATQIPESERSACLEAAMTCGILAPAGPARSRLLSVLYKDDRAQSLPNYRILEKMFLDRLIAPEEVDEFSKTLKRHQLARLSDGTTVLSRAVIEHNVLAASRLYENIGLNELGALLGLEARAAERFARGMIESQRLHGSIDQVSSIVEFSSPAELGNHVETARWDKAIESLLTDVENCAAQVEKQFPDWYQARQLSVQS